MKRLPAAFVGLESKTVTVVRDPDGPAEKRIDTEAHIDAHRGIFPVAVPIEAGDVVEYSDAAGHTERLVAAKVRIFELVKPSHTDVFWEGSLPPRLAEAATLSLGDLHQEVVAAAAHPFYEASYSEAVIEALLALEHRVSRQSGVDALGSDLMYQAFTGDPPAIDIATHKGPPSRAEREGLRRLFMGAVQGIESPLRHEVLHNESPERALESLALVSSLFHLLDRAYEGAQGS